MNWLLRSLPLIALLALAGISCTTTNTIVGSSIAPTIARFFPDTAWTFQTLTIYGTNFGYDGADVPVTIDTALAQILSIDDTVMKVAIPEAARTGFIHVRAYEQTATSAMPVVINYTFHPKPYFIDSAAVGSSFSIPGTGMNNYRGTLRISVNGIPFPVDSVFADRIVSHVVPNSWSGNVVISDSAGSYYSEGSLIVTRPSAWNTLSEIWDRLTVREEHDRTGYINGPFNTIDSTWQTTATYSGQRDLNISGILFEETAQGLNYTLASPPPDNATPLLQITWDTVSQRATVTFNKYSVGPTTSLHSVDTLWDDNGESLPALLPVDGDIEFVLSNLRPQIAEDSTDAKGLVNWREITTSTVTSGSFDLILKH